ncbi:conserved hypothetical protein [Theileria orientalis strain Shintoku]|uniref:Uncharacterized protein n=1 Tax=Theileria orientalis strain Shintoku TaxID=869250 RepID=J4C4F0_THEOR|nr:conserved hypothetical protein [Theileria orientalis strain Shintoku]PVC50847.1 hypothetical protein MACL_00001947 [Theileria orientalis]BAM42071.1 conserved hypothetical protein [Theileria orientalis strain Shintoku]|eukprot:XP_009692372.1 conserved hypothetical protein [Theileria orientalis strain Shintoku]
MPAFVPVFDPEVPRSEQDPNSEKLLKHRKWDNPHVVLPNTNKREKHEKSYKRSNLSYYRDKYNDNNNTDNKRDDKFYRRHVRDEFDYVAPKRKKFLKSDHKSPDDKSSRSDKKVIKTVKKDDPKAEYK